MAIEAGWFEHTSMLAPWTGTVSRQDESTGAHGYTMICSRLAPCWGIGIEAVYRECNIERKLRSYLGYDVMGEGVAVCRSRSDDA